MKRVPASTWDELLSSPRSWHQRYFLSSDETLRQFEEDAAYLDDDIICELEGDEKEIDFGRLLTKVLAQARETIATAKQLLAGNGEVKVDLGSDSAEDFLSMLATFRATHADIRARAIYGQGMNELVGAGQRGIEQGYLRAVSIDPTVQFAPALTERVIRDAITGQGDFAARLKKAAEDGTSGHIGPEYHQLRYLLSFIRGMGLLSKMPDAKRYDFFCKQLGLYPETGENAKAALCAFIKRWEASLVL
jgi:hypothetical protein